jgi:hypothetical protein
VKHFTVAQPTARGPEQRSVGPLPDGFFDAPLRWRRLDHLCNRRRALRSDTATRSRRCDHDSRLMVPNGLVRAADRTGTRSSTHGLWILRSLFLAFDDPSSGCKSRFLWVAIHGNCRAIRKGGNSIGNSRIFYRVLRCGLFEHGAPRHVPIELSGYGDASRECDHDRSLRLKRCLNLVSVPASPQRKLTSNSSRLAGLTLSRELRGVSSGVGVRRHCLRSKAAHPKSYLPDENPVF